MFGGRKEIERREGGEGRGIYWVNYLRWTWRSKVNQNIMSLFMNSSSEEIADCELDILSLQCQKNRKSARTSRKLYTLSLYFLFFACHKRKATTRWWVFFCSYKIEVHIKVCIQVSGFPHVTWRTRLNTARAQNLGGVGER